MLLKFIQEEITDIDADELKLLISKNAAFLCELLNHLIKVGRNGMTTRCPTEWRDFVSALASSSSVCALLHPSEKLFSFLLGLKSGSYVRSMEECQYLQHEVPVLKTFPGYLVPVINEMVKKAKAPFQLCTTEYNTDAVMCSSSNAESDMAFFPSLPVIRSRGTYAMDKSLQTKICTKHRTGHPTLLPGVFTLYCKHGKKYRASFFGLLYIANMVRYIGHLCVF